MSKQAVQPTTLGRRSRCAARAGLGPDTVGECPCACGQTGGRLDSGRQFDAIEIGGAEVPTPAEAIQGHVTQAQVVPDGQLAGT